jgi:hypothetical protein
VSHADDLKYVGVKVKDLEKHSGVWMDEQTL